MALTFLDRDDEQRRLRRFMGGDDSRLAVTYGRRRCGKSTRVQRACGEGDVYTLADERESSLQLQALASEVARMVAAVRHRGLKSTGWDMLDEMRSATQASTLLALVGAGCNRLAEIAARMGKPSGALTRPLTNLLDLGYLRKEVPFGEDERSSKRMLYRIDDPLVALWFRFVQPARTLLQRDLLEPVEATLSTAFPQHCAEAWEVLAREYVPRLRIGGFAWGSASRWWRNGRDALFEFDVVSESLDGESVLFGEAKWASRPDVARWRAELRARDESAPFLRGRRPECALWVKEEAEGGDIITPAAVMAALR